MNRPLEDILASQRRINWTDEIEVRPYQEMKLFDMSLPIAHIKYQYAERILARQRRIEYMDYDSLSEHPLFIPKEDRTGFHPSQITKQKRIAKKFDFGKAKK